uniref:Kinesin motor domain-containing protein n=1 Tax=Macrostomum lignano TaxID=282301 RepID=A0A1I8FDG7_9PLAT
KNTVRVSPVFCLLNSRQREVTLAFSSGAKEKMEAPGCSSTARPETLPLESGFPPTEIRYGEASIPSRHNLGGTNRVEAFQIRLVRGADEFSRGTARGEARESLDCVEKSAGRSSSRLTGYICAAFSEMIDQQSLQTFAIAVHTEHEIEGATSGSRTTFALGAEP